MTFRLGLTGSIGMGKSTTAQFFRAEGIPVWDADAAVRTLYDHPGPGADAIRAICPQAVTKGVVSRETLKQAILLDATLLPRIEQAIHPLVAQGRLHFLSQTRADIALLDIPLLFEGDHQTAMEATLVVTAPAHLQRQRVLARPGMTEAQFQMILSRQMPDAEKRRRATHIVETLSLDQTQAYVRALIAHIRQYHA